MNAEISSAMGFKIWGMLIFLSVLWGGSFFFNEVAIIELPPLTVVLLRVVLAAIVLWVFVAACGLPVPKSLSVWCAFLVMGVLNNVAPFSLIVWGQTHIASGLASILNATTPLFTIIVAGSLLTDERPAPLKLVGVTVGFVGAVFLVGPSALQEVNNDLLAQVAVLGAALSYAFAGVYGRRFKAMGINPVITAAGQVTASSIVLAPIAILIDQPFSLNFPSMQTVMALVGLATLSTALAYIIYFRILAAAGATNLLLVTFLIPVSAILLGNLILDESLEKFHFIGLGFIAVGISIIDGRLYRLIGKTSKCIDPVTDATK